MNQAEKVGSVNPRENERNAQIVALVRSEGFQLFRGRSGTVVMTGMGHSVTCKSADAARTVDAAFDALFALAAGTITEADLEGRDAGDHLHAVGG